MRKCPRNTVFSLLFNNVRRNDMQVAQEALRSYRGVFLFRGILAILFGIVALVWPGITLLFLVYLFGAYALIGGIFATATALRFTHERGWALLLVEASWASWQASSPLSGRASQPSSFSS